MNTILKKLPLIPNFRAFSFTTVMVVFLMATVYLSTLFIIN